MVSSGTCKDSAKVTVIVNPVPIPTIGANKTTICAGDSSTITAGGGVSYLWNNGATTSSITVKPASTTTYTVTVGKNPCTKDTTITINVNSLPVVTITPPQTICSGTSVNLTATGGGTYSWSNGATSSSINVSPIANTTYSVTVTNGGCPKDTTVAITVNPTPTVTVLGNNSICIGDSTKLTATGGGTYIWSNGATTNSITVKPVKDSTFKVLVSNGSCSDSMNVTVTVNTKPIPTISKDTSICAGNTVQLNASGGATYAWSPSAGLSSSTIPNPKATPLVTTEYIDTVSNGGCFAVDSVLITVNPTPVVVTTPYPSVTIVSGFSTPLLVTPAFSYVWTPSAGLSCDTCQSPDASPATTTTYYVTVSSSSGCTATDSILVIVEQNCGQVFVPTAFSPNGDGQNDILLIKGDCIQTIDFKIYDRWGNIVFQTQNMSQGWDGTYMGKPMQAGTYTYSITVLTNNGNTASKKGSISLVR
jgi:gliding motility-associated-like protein